MVKVYSTNYLSMDALKLKQYLKSKKMLKFEDLNVQTDMVAREDMLKKEIKTNGCSCFRYKWNYYSWISIKML